MKWSVLQVIDYSRNRLVYIVHNFGSGAENIESARFDDFLEARAMAELLNKETK